MGKKIKNSDRNGEKMKTEQLLERGVEKLKNFGFINVNKQNLLSDEVYCFFFMRFLNSLKGENSEADLQIDKFLNHIKLNK
jgi:hypothetical protein